MEVDLIKTSNGSVVLEDGSVIKTGSQYDFFFENSEERGKIRATIEGFSWTSEGSLVFSVKQSDSQLVAMSISLALVRLMLPVLEGMHS